LMPFRILKSEDGYFDGGWLLCQQGHARQNERDGYETK